MFGEDVGEHALDFIRVEILETQIKIERHDGQFLANQQRLGLLEERGPLLPVKLRIGAPEQLEEHFPFQRARLEVDAECFFPHILKFDSNLLVRFLIVVNVIESWETLTARVARFGQKPLRQLRIITDSLRRLIVCHAWRDLVRGDLLTGARDLFEPDRVLLQEPGCVLVALLEGGSLAPGAERALHSGDAVGLAAV